MTRAGVVFAVLAHQQPECLLDLIESLSHFQPDSYVLVFNGGQDKSFATGLGLNLCRYSRPISWGRNFQQFHLGVMRQLHEDGIDYDFLVILDSDQLLIAPGLHERLSDLMAEAWWMGAFFTRVDRFSHWWPGRRFSREWWLWGRQLGVRRPYGCYNPGQVFRREYVEALAALPGRDRLLEHLTLARPWMMEEVFFPSLGVALGHGARGWPEPASLALWGPHSPEEITRLAATGEVHLLHRITMEIDAPERLSARALRTGEAVNVAALEEIFIPRVEHNHPPDRTPWNWRPPREWLPRTASVLTRRARLLGRAWLLHRDPRREPGGTWSLDLDVPRA